MAVVVTVATFALIADVAELTISAVLAQAVVVFLLAAGSRRWLAGLAVAPFLANAVEPIGADDDPLLGVLVVVVLLAAGVVGEAFRVRGVAIAERDASRTDSQRSQRELGALAERARIARELHDVIAHHLSMIAVQSETARLTTAGLPPRAAQQFQAIGDTARDALVEMRRVLGVLRTTDEKSEARPGGATDRSPQPGLDQLDHLIESARQSGMTVRLTRSGPRTPTSPGVQLAAYRIVQEALSNTRRHAPGAAVDVEVTFEPDTLTLRVQDDGPGPSGATGGHGLLGMSERAAAAGGTMHAGPGPAGGFLVQAELPTSPPAR